MPPLIASQKVKNKNCFQALKLCHDIESHPLIININLFEQIIKTLITCLTKSK